MSLPARAVVVPSAGRRLRAAEKGLLAAEILVVYVTARWRLRRTTLPETLRALRRPGRQPPRPLPPAVGIRLGRAVVRTLEPLPSDSRCLMRSLVLVRLLARRGVQVRLVLGVAHVDRFEAHAWVEQGETPLLAAGGTRFGRLAEF